MMTDDDQTPYALVVEDDPFIRMDAVSIIEEAGFKSLDAPQADVALPLLAEFSGRIALLFTDVEMPGAMNGFALARHVAAHWPEIGILVASGRVKPGRDDLPAGAIFMSKPFSSEVVHDRLHALLPDGRKPEPLKAMARPGDRPA